MRIDLPQCNFRNCKYQFDGNCTNQLPYGYERCEFNRMKDRLQIDPSGTDKIDELEEAMGYARSERHGRWEIDTDGGFRFVKCSECGRRPRSNLEEPFCPWCGAKMDGKDGVQNDKGR